MNPEFPIHTPETAPEESKEILRHTKSTFGMIPNLEGVMATSPSLLKSYSSMWDEFENTSLTPAEKQVVYQTANFENTCNYCVPWHTYLSTKTNLSDADVEALRQAKPLSDPKLEALRQFTRELILQRGKITQGAFEAFIEAGYTTQSALEVIMGIAIKTMSNFTNSVVGTPLDEAVKAYEWKKPLTDK